MLPYLVLLLSSLACHAAPGFIYNLFDSAKGKEVVINPPAENSRCDAFGWGNQVAGLHGNIHPAVTPNDPPSSVFELNSAGKYTWEQLFDIDNSENAGEIYKLVEYNSSMVCSYKDLKRSLEQSTTGDPVEISLGGSMFEILDIKINGELNPTVKLEYECLSERNILFGMDAMNTKTYIVGPKSKLRMYRLVFNGPGIKYQTDILSSTPYEMKDVQISFKVKQLSVLKDIKVVYAKDSISRPANVITDANGNDHDGYLGFGDERIWLVPSWTTKIDEGATGIEIVVQSEEYSDQDLTSGAGAAGGLYHIKIKMLKDPNAKGRITQVNLLRKSDGSSDNSPGINEGNDMAGDINLECKGGPLSLVYNVKFIK